MELTEELHLVDDAGWWFSIWGGYHESNKVTKFLLLGVTRLIGVKTKLLTDLHQQVSQN